MAGSSIIDTSGGSPSIRMAALATTFVGTVAYGYVLGLLDFVDAAGRGVTSTLDSIGEFFADGVIAGLFGIAETALDVAAAENAEFISGFGIFGQLAAFVEGIVLVVGILFVVTRALAYAGEFLP